MDCYNWNLSQMGLYRWADIRGLISGEFTPGILILLADKWAYIRECSKPGRGKGGGPLTWDFPVCCFCWMHVCLLALKSVCFAPCSGRKEQFPDTAVQLVL